MTNNKKNRASKYVTTITNEQKLNEDNDVNNRPGQKPKKTQLTSSEAKINAIKNQSYTYDDK